MMELMVSTLALWLVWPAVIGLLTYWYLSRKHDYWKQKGVPHVPSVALVGSIFSSFNKPFHEEEMRRYKKYGRLFGHYEGSSPVLNVADPELLRDILVKDFPSFQNRRNISVGEDITSKMVFTVEGEDWKRIRSIITPAFTTGKLKKMLKIFKDCARTLSENFKTAAKEGKAINAKKLFGAFTMDVIASSAFSTKLDSHNEPSNKFVQMASTAFNVKFPWRLILFFIIPDFMRFFKISVFAPKASKFFKEVTLEIIQERKRTGKTRNDFLQLLIDVAKEVKEEEGEEMKESMKEEKEEITSNYGTEENNDIFKQYYKNRSLSHDEMVAQCVIFFLAGYETTATTLSFICYNLALNEGCQDKLVQEIDLAIKDEGCELNYEAIQNMKYLDNVLSETLRVFPPAVRLERKANEDYKLGDTGLTIPKGMIVGVPVYAMHKDPEFFSEPDKFDPDRFLPDEKASRNPYTYLPFGAGPRNCIGMRFALLEIKVCVAYILSHFRVRRCPETKEPLDFQIGQGLLQPKEILLRFEVREDSFLKN